MTLARAGYTVFVWLAAPLAALYLLWRSRRQHEYRAHWGERFGWAEYPPRGSRPLIWLHAVSVGETRAAEPLIRALAERYLQLDFLLTHMTPTGRATGAELAARWPGRITQVYLPYDLPFAVRRFLRAFRPILGVGLETETWPNLLAIANEEHVPVVLVNARLSEKSLTASRSYAGLMREAARRFEAVLAQTEADAERIVMAGAAKVEVIGNLKFDFTPDAALIAQGVQWRRTLGARPVWLFASTREGEETLILDALPPEPRATVIIVPRHPQRFEEVAKAIESRGLALLRRSRLADISQLAGKSGSDPDFVLGDSMGEMAMYYAAADVAFIGGSLLPLGGQNLIEACAVGTPVVIGPHTFNFEQATADAIEAGAAVRVGDAAETVKLMHEISIDAARRRAMSEAAQHFAARHRGATKRAVQRLAPFIDAAS
jgi:3-deoxy-D-manno-octulosonic-acid transferase